jgi:hypothetical protein
MGDILPVEQYGALVRSHQAGDHIEDRGLAGAVGAEQADRLAALQIQADILHHLARAIAFAEIEDFERALAGGRGLGWSAGFGIGVERPVQREIARQHICNWPGFCRAAALRQQAGQPPKNAAFARGRGVFKGRVQAACPGAPACAAP